MKGRGRSVSCGGHRNRILRISQKIVFAFDFIYFSDLDDGITEPCVPATAAAAVASFRLWISIERTLTSLSQPKITRRDRLKCWDRSVSRNFLFEAEWRRPLREQ